MKAVLYGRFSPRPDSATSESIETQMERCRALCLANGWEIEAEFEDRDISGKRADNRPGLQMALECVCRHSGALVAYSLSRLSRSTRDALEIADRLQKCGADLALVTESVNTASPTGRLLFTILAALAQLDREQKAAITKDSMLAHQARGRRMGRKDRLPYGKMLDPKDKKRIVDCPLEQDNIQRIKQAYEETGSLRGAAQVLERHGFLCRGKKWHHSTISSILKAHAQPQPSSSAFHPKIFPDKAAEKQEQQSHRSRKQTT